MYGNCLKKFYSNQNVDILLYLARAHFVYGKLEETRRILIQARHIAPHVRINSRGAFINVLAQLMDRSNNIILPIIILTEQKIG